MFPKSMESTPAHLGCSQVSGPPIAGVGAGALTRSRCCFPWRLGVLIAAILVVGCGRAREIERPVEQQGVYDPPSGVAISEAEAQQLADRLVAALRTGKAAEGEFMALVEDEFGRTSVWETLTREDRKILSHETREVTGSGFLLLMRVQADRKTYTGRSTLEVFPRNGSWVVTKWDWGIEKSEENPPSP